MEILLTIPFQIPTCIYCTILSANTCTILWVNVSKNKVAHNKLTVDPSTSSDLIRSSLSINRYWSRHNCTVTLTSMHDCLIFRRTTVEIYKCSSEYPLLQARVHEKYRYSSLYSLFKTAMSIWVYWFELWSRTDFINIIWL